VSDTNKHCVYIYPGEQGQPARRIVAGSPPIEMTAEAKAFFADLFIRHMDAKAPRPGTGPLADRSGEAAGEGETDGPAV
jgi:hypothetical protein